jgi:Ca-activated chloride channel family protein
MVDLQSPLMLLFLPAIALLAVGYVIQQRRPNPYAVRYSSLLVLKAAARNSWRRHVPAFLFLTGLAVLALASARPVATGAFVPHAVQTVILVVDVSASMSVPDVQPTRLDAARRAIRAFLEDKPTDTRVGVVAFAVNADLVQAPTADPVAVMMALDRLKPDGGTEISAGLEAAHRVTTEALGATLSSTEAPIPARVVLLSDGASTNTTPYQAAADLARDGIPVYTVGVGSAGATLVIAGVTLNADPDEPTLRQIAKTTGGTYSRAFTEDELRAIYAGLASRIVWETERMELAALVAGVGAVVVFVAQLLVLFR